MSPPHPQYISASRRNDLPRFYYNKFFSAWQTGEITYDGGYGRSYTVSLKPEDVLGYVFWSKDFSHFITHPLFKELISSSNAVFHFTLNNCPDLEPRIPPLNNRVETLYHLCEMVGSERVFWRYDPVCKYRNRGGDTITTEEAFFTILPHMKQAGITRCYFSFMTNYKKLKKRDLLFLAIEKEERLRIAEDMAVAAADAGVILYNCCNEDIPGSVPLIQKAHCVDTSVLAETDRFGVHRECGEKPTRAGCGCFESRDIGSYSPACPHGCIYCYANPQL